MVQLRRLPTAESIRDSYQSHKDMNNNMISIHFVSNTYQLQIGASEEEINAIEFYGGYQTEYAPDIAEITIK